MKIIPRWIYCLCWFSVAISQLYIWLFYAALSSAWLAILYFWPSQDRYFTEVLSSVGTVLYFLYQTFSIESGLSNQSQLIFKEHAISNYILNKFGYENSVLVETVYVDPRGDIGALKKIRQIAEPKDDEALHAISSNAVFFGSDGCQFENGVAGNNLIAELKSPSVEKRES